MKGGLKLCRTALLNFSPFKFFNFMVDMDDFIPTISSVWSTVAQSSKQFQVCKKLKLSKQQLKRLNMDLVGNVSNVVVKSKADLDMCQGLLDSNPFDNSL